MVRAALSSAVALVALPALVAVALPTPARANNVFEVCKGESKTAVAGTGKRSIAVVYLNDFPVTTTPAMRNAVAAPLARQEKAKIVPAKDVEAAKRLVDEKKWSERSEACGQAPSLVAVLGQRHPNLGTGTASIACEGSSCELRVDLERHGARSAERWVRYAAPLGVAEDAITVKAIQKAAAKLAPKGPPPDAPRAGLAVDELPPGVVTVRSNIDGALESDRVLEASAALAACAPKGRKPHDTRGYWAEWKLSAKGNPFQVMVKPFAGRDPADAKAAKCLEKAIQATQLRCPRDGKVLEVKTAICL